METTDPAVPAAPRRVLRSRTDRWIAGVSGGLADYFKVDPALIRLAFVALTIFWGIGIPMYLFAWLIIPNEGEVQSIGERTVDRLNSGLKSPPDGD